VKRDSAEAQKMLKKRGAYPKSGARIVRRFCVEPDSSSKRDSTAILTRFLHTVQSLAINETDLPMRQGSKTVHQPI
jgi:hypothetical protein